jgi:hypothetical protein
MQPDPSKNLAFPELNVATPLQITRSKEYSSIHSHQVLTVCTGNSPPDVCDLGKTQPAQGLRLSQPVPQPEGDYR